MKHTLIILWSLLVTFSLQAQDNRLLRDSLKKVAEQVEYHPDSVELRLQKAALNMQGFNVGSPRLPLTELTDAHKETLRRAMIDFGCL